MNYVTTNIRINEEDYLRLKAEAAKKRKSLSAIIRDRLKARSITYSQAKAKQIIAETKKLAKENAQKLKGFDVVRALREMRYEDKW